MAISVGGMALAASGFLSSVAGALVQEGIDLLAVLNALRMVRVPKSLTDLSSSSIGFRRSVRTISVQPEPPRPKSPASSPC
jgi:hypothetical protein